MPLPEDKGLQLEDTTGKKPPPWPPPILVTQVNPSSLTTAHSVMNPVVVPPVTTSPGPSFRFNQLPAPAEIHEFLFKIRKGGEVFWLGAAVPKSTTDFTRSQVFFHPTVMQKGAVVADDKDYPDFKRGWPLIRRYVAMEGGQLAYTGRFVPVLFPFVTMAASRLKAPAKNMFSNRPVDTLRAVMAALETAVTGNPVSTSNLETVGATSFSSGITAMRLFLSQMLKSRLVKEIVDLDSPCLTTEPKRLTRSPGAVSRCFTQAHGSLEVGYVVVTEAHFTGVASFPEYPEPIRTHQLIGWMMYYQAMVNSVIR
jgi:hypothetical protein